MIVSEKSIAIKANTMGLVLLTIFGLSAAVCEFNAIAMKKHTLATKASEEIARIDETPDRHDASGGKAITQSFSLEAIA